MTGDDIPSPAEALMPATNTLLAINIPTPAEALAEIRRLRERGRELETLIDGMAELNAVLRARILELEAAQAVTLGTLEKPTPDEPARYTHDVPPSAPPHDE